MKNFKEKENKFYICENKMFIPFLRVLFSFIENNHINPVIANVHHSRPTLYCLLLSRISMRDNDV